MDTNVWTFVYGYWKILFDDEHEPVTTWIPVYEGYAATDEEGNRRFRAKVIRDHRIRFYDFWEMLKDSMNEYDVSSTWQAHFTTPNRIIIREWLSEEGLITAFEDMMKS